MGRRSGFDSVRLGRCSYVGFMVYGVLEILVALTLAVVYFKIRSFTTSLDKIETVPTYANAIMLMCTGILNIVLYIKRHTILLWPTGSMCVLCLLFFSICAVLSGLQTSGTYQRIQTCAYNVGLYQCECYILQSRVATSGNSIIAPAMSKLVYEGAPSCEGIRTGLRYCTYGLYGLYALGAILCLCGFLMVLVINNKTRKRYPVNDMIPDLDGDYMELVRSGSSASNFSGTAVQNVDQTSTIRSHGHRASRPPGADLLESRPPPLPPRPRRPPHKRRRRARFCKQITLPGMGFCLLNQQLRLPGEEHLQLLSVQRTGSFDRGQISVGSQGRDTGQLSGGVVSEVAGDYAVGNVDGVNLSLSGVPEVGSHSPSVFVRGSEGLGLIGPEIDQAESRPIFIEDLNGTITPGNSVQMRIERPRHEIQRADNSTNVLYRIESPRVLVQRTQGLPPGLYRPLARPGVGRQLSSPELFTGGPPALQLYQPARVQRSISLQQTAMPFTAAPRPPPRRARRELTRSQSDNNVQSQRAVNLFRIGRAVQHNRSNAPPPSRPSTRTPLFRPLQSRAQPYRTSPHRGRAANTTATAAQRSQSERVARGPPPRPQHDEGSDQCSHCREYRRFRRVCRAYSSCLPASAHAAYPLPQHLMLMNYMMSTEGAGQEGGPRGVRPPHPGVGVGLGLRGPPVQYEPPPPYQEDGPPPYSPGPFRRSMALDR